MASSGAAAPGAFFDEVVADLVSAPISSTAPTASSPAASPAMGELGENAGQPMLGAPVGDFAGLPSVGAAALVEPAAGDEDLAPPVMGVPPSSDEEEELLADIAGAHPFPDADVVDGEAQTEHIAPILAFDTHDVAVQTSGEVFFSSFVGDSTQVALAAAIRALSPGSLFRLDGALRQAHAQPLVDVAPAFGGGAQAAPAPPEINLLDDTPVEPPSSSSGVVDPGPGPASARIFWEEQNATAVAEQAAVRPLPDDDFDPPATALEAYLQDQDDAARTTSAPSPLGPQPSSSKSPGGKTPFRKAPPPALVLETPEAKVSKAPPLPYPDRPIAFLAEPPKKPPVKRAPVVPPKQSTPTAAAVRAAAPASSPAASSSSEPVVAKAAAGPVSALAPGEAAPVPAPGPDAGEGPYSEHLRRQAFIRQEQMARSLAGMRLLHDGATYAQALQSRIEREMEEQRRGGLLAPSRCSTPTRSSWTGTFGRNPGTWRPEKLCLKRLGGRMVGATSCS